MAEMFSLKGKTALITGGGRGLGKSMAIALAAAGADVAVASRTGQQLKDTVEELKNYGVRATNYAVDVTKLADIDKLVTDFVNEFGKIDILVNGAGMNIRKPVIDVTEEDWDYLMAVNLKSAFFVSQAVAKAMIPKKSGKIINLASLTSVIGLPNICMYGASKGGISQLTKGMAVEWAQYNIQVNAIGPGYFKTAMTAALFEKQESVKALINRIPIGRIGVGEDLFGATVFLASDASNYITGQTIYVDGGWLAC